MPHGVAICKQKNDDGTGRSSKSALIKMDDRKKQVRVVQYIKAVRLLSNEWYLGNCKVSFVKRGVLTVGNLYICNSVLDIQENLHNHSVGIDVHSGQARSDILSISLTYSLFKTVLTFSFSVLLNIRMFLRWPLSTWYTQR